MELLGPEACPNCGSDDIAVKAPQYGLYMCYGCDEHFTDVVDEQDDGGAWESYGRHRERLRESDE